MVHSFLNIFLLKFHVQNPIITHCCNYIKKDIYILEMVVAAGSSHLFRYASTAYAKQNANSPYRLHMKGFSEVISLSGLTVMDECFEKDTLKKMNSKPPKKILQFEDFAAALETCGDIEALLVDLSNDYKTYVTDHEGNMLNLISTAVRKWKDMDPELKCDYNVFTEKSWTKTTRLHIFAQFKKYEKILKPILGNSPIEILHHSSILERLNPKIPNLDLYFAILNSVLEHFLKRWTKNKAFKNKHGKAIVCRFVSVKDQFFNAKFKYRDQTSLFTFTDIEKGKELTHRNAKAMDELARKWSAKVIK